MKYYLLILILLIFMFGCSKNLENNNLEIKDNYDIQEKDCKLLNNKDGKIKFLFIPDKSYNVLNYYNDFIEDIEYHLDYDGNNYGLFSVEPIKSHKDKISIYYLSKISEEIKCGIAINRDNQVEDCLDPLLKISKICSPDIMVVLVKNGYNGKAYQNTYVQIFNEKEDIEISGTVRALVSSSCSYDKSQLPDDYINVLRKDYSCASIHPIDNVITTVHEFGHLFGLADMYSIGSEVTNPKSFVNTPNMNQNCDVKGCPKWCKSFDESLASINKGNIGIECGKELGCYKNCGGTNLWKPINYPTIMDSYSYQQILDGIPYKFDPISYEVINNSLSKGLIE